jgi:TonB family protein
MTVSLEARAQLRYISSAMRAPTLLALTTFCAALMVAQQAAAPPAGVTEVAFSELKKLNTSPEVTYPSGASKHSVQGKVVLGLTLAPDGKVEQVDVLEGPPELAKATAKTVKKWAFLPYGSPPHPRLYTKATFNFGLKDRARDCGDPPAVSAPPVPMPDGTPLPERVRVSQGVSQAMLCHQVAPHYPPDARQARIQGQVVMAADVGKDGTIQNLQLVSGHPMLAEAAMVAVRQWRYRPYMLNGRPVIVETQITVNFTLSP